MSSSFVVADPELARARRNTKLQASPSCVPAILESQSRVSISSESHSRKSMGFNMALSRSANGLRLTSRGIVARPTGLAIVDQKDRRVSREISK